MHKEYLEELEALKQRMIKAEAFAKRLPIFSEAILERKLDAEDHWIDFGKQYKKLYLAWGIKRGFYEKGGARTITNYPKDKDFSAYLFNIYINSCQLFDCHELFDLDEAIKDVDIFFADKMNSTFYVTDKNIEPFLEALNTWVIAAYEKLNEHRKIERLKELETEMAKLRA